MAREFCSNKTAPIVETTKGKLRGFRFDGVDHFYGIRYAKAKRFQMPEPVKPWEGVKEAGSYGMICPVLYEPQPMGEIQTPHRFWPSSEHCQYLNVWTSKCDKKAKKPVLFWIHGGGYSAGSAIEQVCYDGFNLAKLDDVVVVSVNHRLNAFGYLDMSDFGEKYWNSVNVGMADLVEALKWVRDNIAAFGGDPDNVTIFGQSGGGGKVTVLGQIPEANGLFHKMIVMSGVIPPGDFASSCTPKELVKEILKNLRIKQKDVERLEKVPTPQFIWAVNKATETLAQQGKRVGWEPKPNSYYVCDPLAGDFTEHALTIPTMVGTVIAEFGMPKDLGERAKLKKAEREAAVLEYYGEEGGKKILKAFKKAFPKTNATYAMDLDTMFLPATLDYVKKKAQEASAPVYNYLFTKEFDYDGGRAAWHCSDIPYFFHNAELIPICHQKNYEKLDKVMSGAFVNFARTGNPNGGELPQWDACADGRLVTMIFDDECVARENLHDDLLPLVKQYKPPFKFNFKRPSEDEDEESGNAWVF
ncbi:MAG: carboxylesterase/lipase family protein [Clostridia bacterium]|nr:carboxylesterase/lipase family protein [Clostridia bacterium]